jgi:hypothetical protein
MKRILVREAVTQNIYSEVSSTFREIGENLQKYFEVTIYQKYKDIPMQGIMQEDNIKNQNILNWVSKKFIYLKESEEGIALLNKIIIEEKRLLNRIQILINEILPNSNNYDIQPGANNLTIANIKVFKDTLETHEHNKKHNLYDKGPTELRKLQETLRIYQDLAKLLNSYLIEQNTKPAQTDVTDRHYPNNGRLILMFDKQGKLNTKVL